jgi:hypothetical protein
MKAIRLQWIASWHARFCGTGAARNPLVAVRVWLVKRIVWRMQALDQGDLSERARRRAAELAHDADLRQSPPQPHKLCPNAIVQAGPAGRAAKRNTPHLRPGTVLARKYRGDMLEAAKTGGTQEDPIAVNRYQQVGHPGWVGIGWLRMVEYFTLQEFSPANAGGFAWLRPSMRSSIEVSRAESCRNLRVTPPRYS